MMVCFFLEAAVVHGQEPLRSWRDGATKEAIVSFVERIVAVDTPDYVPPDERIAVFDNDGTLWCEQPMYVQMAFVLDRVRSLAAEHPEWNQQQPFQSVLSGDLKGVAATGERGLVEMVMATHAGMTTDEFADVVSRWLAMAKHPVYRRPYTECVYQPMLEMLDYLRSHRFKIFIVSGGGVEFMRPWVQRVYGIPPEQVIGSRVKLKYEVRAGEPVLVRLPELEFIDDKSGKPVGIQQAIGRRPIIAVGNSDGDYEMLQYVTAGKGPRLGVIVHHTDGSREVAYDRGSPFGRLDRALTEASEKGWILVDMERDWNAVFPASR